MAVMLPLSNNLNRLIILEKKNNIAKFMDNYTLRISDI